MSVIDVILSICGVLLLLSWRSLRLQSRPEAATTSLITTLRRAEPARLMPWHLLAVLLLLLLGRAFLYWQVGPAMNWAPKLDLYFVTPVFRVDRFGSVLLFSLLSFLRILIVAWFWLVVLAALNQGSSAEPIQKLIRLQIGSLASIPAWLLWILPFVMVGLLWLGLHPLLERAGIINHASSGAHLAEQCALIGLCLYLSLKYLLPLVLFIHILTSYIYLGTNPFWDYAAATSRSLLRPLARLPLRSPRIDFTPLFGMVLLLLALHALPEFVVHRMRQNDIPPWPS